MSQKAAWRMVRKSGLAPASSRRSAIIRSVRLGSPLISPTAGTLEHAQSMAVHESPRTTKLYDRTKERLTQDEIERIVM